MIRSATGSRMPGSFVSTGFAKKSSTPAAVEPHPAQLSPSRPLTPCVQRPTHTFTPQKKTRPAPETNNDDPSGNFS
jgi:hypothetical protein